MRNSTLNLIKAGQLLQAASWRFASTLPNNPHRYTLLEHWDAEEFASVAQFIRDAGYKSMFGGKEYTQLNINEYYYWTMGAPIEETRLINRKRRKVRAKYDAISHKYDTLFRDAQSEQENREAIQWAESITGNLSEKSVLDVGCGTGLLLEHVLPHRYVGIDPSAGMLTHLHHRHPHAAIVQTELECFVPSVALPQFDVILALFGSGSYLSKAEQERIPSLLTPGGTAVLMFYTTGKPFTYQATHPKETPEHHPMHLQGTQGHFTTYGTLVYQRAS